ncbi:hypothetical protein, partial [Enterobacter hormaechei]
EAVSGDDERGVTAARRWPGAVRFRGPNRPLALWGFVFLCPVTRNPQPPKPLMQPPSKTSNKHNYLYYKKNKQSKNHSKIKNIL